ncbi:4-hydroxy-3-methylbut-2-enyl diphosphate reductase [Perlabentimonas gracilis]|uniref:4-hydroxy-3-methylbut-2-enyl diphosphate reductase n=1 Tax=Perlabentimonas gracilis TaxID=2715279 RepID=UPI00140A5B8E|nr:4-hydroxy-3-methylbut-2-enyl diphosphate reductase [Perlabentimonas gracilis]NHB68403.1 4-hydroxy-3-methylbut-2-enyl diphosphate reductase [Perlabentimonas gracilis]
MSNNSNIKVEIDSHSGFCFGVVNAISQAEHELDNDDKLYCLGQIVHNSEEEERLKARGLITISHNDLDKLEGKKVLLRAHGEPPETYQKALKNNIKLIDASCPVVLKLQTKVREGWERMNAIGGQIVIYGKKGHAEVVGLVGQTNGNAIVIESISEVDSLDFSKPVELFAQTTKSADEYQAISQEISKRLHANLPLKAHNSICGQVANRKKELMEFSKKHDVILFVSGKNSSNGKMLCEVCKSINDRTHFVSSPQEVDEEWFLGVQSVGVCGATSTPLWLMQQVGDRVKQPS